jgi:alpha-1,3-rhamnosyl/mannosyltransferase
VIAVSEYTRSMIERHLGVPPERISVCPSGAPPWQRRRDPAPGGPILFIGTLDPRKNIPALLRAYGSLVARLPDAPPLLLAGAAGPRSADVLRTIAEPPLAGRVRHLGYVTDDERQRLYAEASMLVLPSYDEGFGVPLLEAMTLGVPAIAARRGALPEVGGDAAILFEPDDDAALAAAMNALLTSPERARIAADAGVERARAFSWEATAGRLRDAYETAIARRRERTGR